MILRIGIILMISALLLAACGKDNSETNPKKNNQDTEMDSGSDEDMEMEHSDSGEVPDDLEEATNPTFEVGSKAMIETDHMKGMKGAEATVVGAYDTIAYVITYTPTTGGEEVKDHKWVIQEEIENADDETLDAGTEVTVDADHMKGMKGAKAEIESSEETTVYMIDYTPTTGAEKVKNHKWVTADELSSE